MRDPAGSPIRRRHAAALLAAILLCASAPGAGSAGASREVSFRTADGITIAGAWYEPSVRPAPAVVLVHMLGRSRRDWDGVASRLASDGIGALAIDLRGHGESQNMPLPSAPPEFAALVADVSAARRYLGSRADVLHTRIGIAGASMGANLAVLAAAGDPAVASLVLLSPSADYRGLRIEAAARKYTRPILLVASDEDAYAGRSVKDLQKAGGGVREVLLLSHAGHGTTMLSRDPDLARALVDWFRRTL